MHDITSLEAEGVPGVFIASTEFQEAASAQALALGFEPARLFVQHPIQDRTDDEVRALADAVFEAVLAAIQSPAPS